MSTEKAALAAETAKPDKNGNGGTPLMRRVTLFLTSMKLALTLLFVIAILSIIGTILPQGDQVLESDWVNSPLFDFYNTLGLFDMYYSWWFLSILVLLLLNIGVCITKRLPATMKNLTRPRIDVKDVFVTSQQMSATFPDAGERGLAIARDVLGGHRFKIRTGETGAILAEKGRFSPFASIMFHLSFILIAVGAVIGYSLEYDETLEIPDGRTAKVPGMEYEVKNHGFMMDTEPIYENGRLVRYMPSLYTSDLEIFVNGQSVARKKIEVNSPLKIKTAFYDLLTLEGVSFHQNSYYPTNRGYVTVIGVRHMPGKNIIYLGFIAMMAGIMFALYFPHRRVWLKISKSGDLLVGGRSNRSKVTFKKEFDRMTSELRTTLGRGGKSDG